MMMNPSRSPYIRDHAPGGRSGPNHCQACSERWPCDWAVLCEIVEEAEATGRAAVRALEWLKAIAYEYHLVSGYAPSLGYKRHEYSSAVDGLVQAMNNADAVLATDTARAWREDGE